ncbi:MAG: MaoC family dehydratase [Candidatus Dormibacteria bacterium]
MAVAEFRSHPGGVPLSSSADETRWPAEVDLFWEDLEVGRAFQLGEHRVTQEEILDFGRRYDPQPFHVNPEAARRSHFQGLIASGWQSCAIWMRLYYEAVLRRSASLGSPGVEEVRWLSPVRPGDVLTGEVRVLQARLSRSRPHWGLAQLGSELTGQDGVTRLSLRAWGLFGRRPPTEPG